MADKSPPDANQLWGGRFEGGLAEIMEKINASIFFDNRRACCARRLA